MTNNDTGIRKFLLKAFDIRAGEINRALLMQLNIFLIITTLLIVKPTVNGLFVSQFGAAGLPKAYILVAFFAIIVSLLYTRLMSRSSLLTMIIGTFVVNVFVLAGFGLILKQQSLPGWELYFIYIWVSVFGVFSASQFWILANLLFNVREAKRLFGFIGAGAIVGGILGGYITKLLAPLIGSENMLFVSSALLFFCIPITLFIWNRYIKNQYRSGAEEKKRVSRHVSNSLALIARSKHLTYLAAIIGVSVIVAKLVDFQYSDIAAQQITDKDQLTAFFGFWFSNFSIISLLLQLFVTRRLLGKLGISGALLSLPGGILIGAFALLFFPELWAAVLIKGADGSLKQSVYKAAIELLGLPVPLEVKKRTKTFIDVVVDSVATGIGGLILIFLVRGLSLPTAAITLMIIALLAGWIFFILKVRREYLQSFRINILKIRPEKEEIDLSSRSLLKKLEEILRTGEEREILWVLQQVRDLGEERFFDPCRRLLDHPSAEVRAGALRALYAFDSKNLKEQVWQLTEDPDPAVRIAAFDYLVSFDSEQLPKIRDIIMSDDIDFRVRGPILVSIATETSNNPKLREMLGVESFIRERIPLVLAAEDPEELSFRKKILAEGIGKAGIPNTFSLLEKLMKDPDTEVVRQAVLAAGETNDPHFIKPLTEFLTKKDTRNEAIMALVNYGPGVLDYLQPIVDDPATDLEITRQVTEVAERLETLESVDFLFQLSDHEDQGVQIEALRSLTDLKRNYPHIRFNSRIILQRVLNEADLYEETLSILYAQMNNKKETVAEKVLEARKGLMRLLEHRLENHFERIFRLLGLRYSPSDFTMFFKGGMKNGKREFQANTIEFLENLLHPNLKKVVIPIVESAMTETITRELIDNMKIDVPQELECFQMLLESNDIRIKLAIFYLFEQLNDPTLLPFIEPYLDSPNAKVSDYANRVYNKIAAS